MIFHNICWFFSRLGEFLYYSPENYTRANFPIPHVSQTFARRWWKTKVDRKIVEIGFAQHLVWDLFQGRITENFNFIVNCNCIGVRGGERGARSTLLHNVTSIIRLIINELGCHIKHIIIITSVIIVVIRISNIIIIISNNSAQ